jgi:DnaK suppressor protein
MARPKASKPKLRTPTAARRSPSRNGSRDVGRRAVGRASKGVRKSAKPAGDSRATLRSAGIVVSRLKRATAIPVLPFRQAARPVVAVRAKARSLTKDEVKEFRRMLEEERKRLSAELQALEDQIPKVEHQLGMDVGGSYDEDFADVATDTFEREKGFAIESTVEQMLKQVEDALGRLDKGQYGICEWCGNPIHPQRLRALPYAKLCIDCKAREEQGVGLGG